ncbi:MAG: DUF3667 domain-containing protein [Acidobacteria bacterium]|nr:DUF3667 domain-containing protein [Acidobacteriota bacterium]
MEPLNGPARCPNCEAPLSGPYCASCGQKDEHRILPLKHLLHEVFHDIAHLDARFLRTLGRLMVPGALTLEYIQGRRVRWFPPFRLYLMASLAFFALAALGPTSKDFRLKVNRPAQVIALDGTPVPDEGGVARLAKRAEEINKDPGAFVARLMSWLPRVFFVLLPFFALLLKLAYLRTRTLYAVHAIFSLHEHAFLFLTLALVKLLGWIPYVRGVRGLLFLALPLHLVLGLKRVYGQGWTLTILKAGAIAVLHGIAVMAVLVLTTLGLMLAS